MFCPNCKIEYRSGFGQCSDCGATLVPTLESHRDPADQDLALAWRGNDPAGFSAAQAELNSAGIRNFSIGDHDQLAWGLAIPKPRYGLLVRKSDLSAAREIVKSIEELPPIITGFWKSEGDPIEVEEDPDTALPVPADEEENAEPAPDDIPEDREPADVTAVVWSGDASIVEALSACLRENGISSVIVAEGQSAKILVTPNHEARAKEIIREVIDATPPE